mgnify:CR=1 FL=1
MERRILVMDRDYFSIENQQKRIQENQEIKKAEKRFKKLMKSDSFKIESNWHINKGEIDFSHLKDHKPNYIETDNYSIYEINKIDLFKILNSTVKDTFQKKNIWTKHSPFNITKVLIHWEKGDKLIPPILNMDLTKTNFILEDGKHRFAVFNYFEEVKLPIIVPDIFLEKFKEICSDLKIKEV